MSLFSHKATNTFNEMGVRERSLIFITVMALIFYIWDALFMTSIQSEEKLLEAKRQPIEIQLTQLSAVIKELQGKVKEADQKNAGADNEFDFLNNEIRRLDKLIVDFTSGAVKPNEIIGALKRVLTDVEGLKVARMNVLDATPLDESALADIKKYVSTKVFRLYKHEIEIELHGNYLGTYEYLRKLESYHQAFYWNEITYKALAWPTAQINLKVYTLTSRKDGAGA